MGRVSILSQKWLLVSFFVMCSILTMSAHAEDFDQFKLDLILAKRGDPGAQFYVASAYEEGRGVKKDLKQAFEWFSQAAQNKHNGAQFKLGEFYENGWGVKKDMAKAEAWYKTAEKNGSRLAKKRLAQMKAEKKALLNAKSSKDAAAKKKKLEQERKQRLAKERERRIAAEKARREKKAKQQAKARKAKISVPVVAKIKPTARKKNKVKKISKEEKAALSAKHAKVVFSNKWSDEEGAASILPSSVNNCLESTDKEIVCFSKEQQKLISHSDVTYTSKSIMKDFKSNGEFVLSYYFNVLDISNTPETGENADALGLRVEKGWQEPELKMLCKLKKQKIQCQREGRKFIYHY